MAHNGMLVHDSLNPGEQFGNPLDLVHHGPVWESAEESNWVINGELPLSRILKGDIWLGREGVPGQGGLA
ncbi:unannotated protein [freshwater metagenome]|uniref:Unannotated protein n=1 Tax=freshwater metagenome TaxID=449393 RepID=A0A6J7QWZ3_9ZZZZ